MNLIVYIGSLLLAVLMGFAVHRASLCTVKTVGELLSSRKAYMMATLVKAVLWMAAVSVPILLCLPDLAARKLKAATAAYKGLAPAPDRRGIDGGRRNADPRRQWHLDL